MPVCSRRCAGGCGTSRAVAIVRHAFTAPPGRAKMDRPPERRTAGLRANHVSQIIQSSSVLRWAVSGAWAMVQVPPSVRQREHPVRELLDGRDAARHELEISALREENSELRRLVIHLSKLVIKNVLEQKY